MALPEETITCEGGVVRCSGHARCSSCKVGTMLSGTQELEPVDISSGEVEEVKEVEETEENSRCCSQLGVDS